MAVGHNAWTIAAEIGLRVKRTQGGVLPFRTGGSDLVLISKRPVRGRSVRSGLSNLVGNDREFCATGCCRPWAKIVARADSGLSKIVASADMLSHACQL